MTLENVIPERYQPAESIRYVHTSGRTASVYGAVPWGMGGRKEDWTLTQNGWTVRDVRENTVGMGLVPFKTREEAQEFCDVKNVSIFLTHAYHHVARNHPDNDEAKIILARWRPVFTRQEVRNA